MKTLPNTIYEHDSNIVARLIAGELILVPIRKNLGDMEHIYIMNETAARIWDLIDGQRTLEQVFACILDEFDVDPDQAEQDFVELIQGLVEIGALAKK